MHEASKTVIVILSAVILSVSLCLYNNFPITYPDTAAYLASGIENMLPLDRPIFYGWFLRHTHMLDNLFFSVFAQGILASIVIYFLFRYFSPFRNKLFHYLLSILFLTFFTGYSFFVSYLMPDIFTPVLFVTIACLYFGELKKSHLWVMMAITIYATVVHNSHFLIFFLMLIFLGATYIVWNKRETRTKYLRNWLRLAALFGGAIALTLTINFSFTSRVFLSQNGHVFMTSRLNETGILKSFLDDRCDEKNYVLCPYKDSIPGDFIWDMKSPLHKTGGFQSSRSAYREMIMDVLTDFKYLKQWVSVIFSSTLYQFGSFEIEPHHPNILAYINEHFPNHRRTQEISMQNRAHKRLDFTKLNDRQNIFVYGALAFLILLLLFYQQWDYRHKQLIIFFLVAILINAVVCSTFSAILTRYQGRVVFLIPLVLMLIFPSLNLGRFFRHNGPEAK